MLSFAHVCSRHPRTTGAAIPQQRSQIAPQVLRTLTSRSADAQRHSCIPAHRVCSLLSLRVAVVQMQSYRLAFLIFLILAVSRWTAAHAAPQSLQRERRAQSRCSIRCFRSSFCSALRSLPSSFTSPSRARSKQTTTLHLGMRSDAFAFARRVSLFVPLSARMTPTCHSFCDSPPS